MNLLLKMMNLLLKWWTAHATLFAGKRDEHFVIKNGIKNVVVKCSIENDKNLASETMNLYDFISQTWSFIISFIKNDELCRRWGVLRWHNSSSPRWHNTSFLIKEMMKLQFIKWWIMIKPTVIVQPYDVRFSFKIFLFESFFLNLYFLNLSFWILFFESFFFESFILNLSFLL